METPLPATLSPALVKPGIAAVSATDTDFQKISSLITHTVILVLLCATPILADGQIICADDSLCSTPLPVADPAMTLAPLILHGRRQRLTTASVCGDGLSTLYIYRNATGSTCSASEHLYDVNWYAEFYCLIFSVAAQFNDASRRRCPSAALI